MRFRRVGGAGVVIGDRTANERPSPRLGLVGISGFQLQVVPQNAVLKLDKLPGCGDQPGAAGASCAIEAMFGRKIVLEPESVAEEVHHKWNDDESRDGRS